VSASRARLILLAAACGVLVGLLSGPRLIAPVPAGEPGPAPSATASVARPAPGSTMGPAPTRSGPPPAARLACPRISANRYGEGTADQYDADNPVRPAWLHADKNLALRGYTPTTDPGLRRELVDYGFDDLTAPPQLATLFQPARVPPLIGFYRVADWIWAPSPDPGRRGAPLARWPATALGLGTAAGERLHVPASGYDIGGGMEVLVLFADADTVALRYTREDSSGPAGYTLHVDRICTDPELLALYRRLDDPDGPRQVFSPPSHSYPLPNLLAGQPIGAAAGREVVVAIVDTGSFMDPRSCNDWWRLRPGYRGSCLRGP
jgi:hypothetical protein